jgi:hypothetical protein
LPDEVRPQGATCVGTPSTLTVIVWQLPRVVSLHWDDEQSFLSPTHLHWLQSFDDRFWQQWFDWQIGLPPVQFVVR